METLQCGNNSTDNTQKKGINYWTLKGRWKMVPFPETKWNTWCFCWRHPYVLIPGLLLRDSHHHQQQAPLFHQELASQRCWTLSTWFSIRYHSHSQHQHKLSVPVVFVLLCWVGLADTLSFKINWVCLKTFKRICVASGPFLKEMKNYCLWNSIRN